MNEKYGCGPKHGSHKRTVSFHLAPEIFWLEASLDTLSPRPQAQAQPCAAEDHKHVPMCAHAPWIDDGNEQLIQLLLLSPSHGG